MPTPKITTKQLYALRNAARDAGFRADVYFRDELGCPNSPIAWARDIHHVERKLVIWKG